MDIFACSNFITMEGVDTERWCKRKSIIRGARHQDL